MYRGPIQTVAELAASRRVACCKKCFTNRLRFASFDDIIVLQDARCICLFTINGNRAAYMLFHSIDVYDGLWNLVRDVCQSHCRGFSIFARCDIYMTTIFYGRIQ